jgi:hypothetical protein
MPAPPTMSSELQEQPTQDIRRTHFIGASISLCMLVSRNCIVAACGGLLPQRNKTSVKRAAANWPLVLWPIWAAAFCKSFAPLTAANLKFPQDNLSALPCTGSQGLNSTQLGVLHSLPLRALGLFFILRSLISRFVRLQNPTTTTKEVDHDQALRPRQHPSPHSCGAPFDNLQSQRTT